MDRDHALAFKYLYAMMPMSDLVTYSPEVFRSFSDPAVDLWMADPAVREIPEEIWLPYVLFHRVNEEEIRPCRAFFASQLRPRTAGKKPYDAIVEANYWCAEQGTYHGTDRRTISPAAFYACGSGRCGEESAFCVTALRSAGIPARQVYVPRWAHCDDNHAWVEAWCGGRWVFFGACEPLLTLNRGWFPQAASRAMIVHSRYFCPEGCGLLPEEPEADVIGREGGLLVLNQTARYADTVRFTVHAADRSGKPAGGAAVRLQLLNGAEFCDIAQLTTDSGGKASVTVGKGSVRVCADVGEEHVSCLADTGRETAVLLTAGGTDKDAGAAAGNGPAAENGTAGAAGVDMKTGPAGKETRGGAPGWISFDFRAPAETLKWPSGVPDEQRQRERKKLERASEIRESRTGNYVNPAVRDFLSADPETAARRKKLLSVLSAKDLADCPAEILRELERAYASAETQGRNDEKTLRYVISPRIAWEVLSLWRRDCGEHVNGSLREDFRKDPRKIREWISADIREIPGRERSSLITPPGAVLRSGYGSTMSMKVLFTAVCRTLGIPARLSPLDLVCEYDSGSGWVTADPAETRDAELVIDAADAGIRGYGSSWTAATVRDGEEHTLDIPGALEGRPDSGEIRISVPHGTYRFVTSLRLPNGSQKAETLRVQLKPGETRRVRLAFRRAELSEMTADCHLPDFLLRPLEACGQDRSMGSGSLRLKDLTGSGPRILFWLDAGKEPTEHILNELHDSRDEFGEIQKSLVFLLKDAADIKDPLIARALGDFPRCTAAVDPQAENAEPCARASYVSPEDLPLIILTDGPCHGIFARAGYSVGTAEMLLRLWKTAGQPAV
ncbi:MAG: transglutaminase domain-containing protein [Lachnospiraceae bacterium]